MNTLIKIAVSAVLIAVGSPALCRTLATSQVKLFVDPVNGTDDAQHGTSPGSGAFKTCQFAVIQAETQFDYGGTTGALITLTSEPGGFACFGEVDALIPMLGGARQFGFTGLIGPTIEIVGDENNRGDFVWRCDSGASSPTRPPSCILPGANIVYVHGVTFDGTSNSGTAIFAVQALGRGMAVVADDNVVNFSLSLGQPFGAGDGGKILFGDFRASGNSDVTILTDSLTFLTGNSAVMAFSPEFEFIMPSPVKSQFWTDFVTGMDVYTYGPAIKFTGNGVSGSTGNRFVCDENSVLSIGGGVFPGSGDMITTGCVVNGVQN